MTEKLIESCLERMARAQRNNGKGVSNKQLLAEGAEIFKKKILGGKNMRTIREPEKMAQELFCAEGVNSLMDGLRVARSVSNGYEIEMPHGRSYFERDGQKIIVGYSPYE
ncbi:MAG: hypothetical protein AABX28_02285 [Nanoarchaeota archaeon]